MGPLPGTERASEAPWATGAAAPAKRGAGGERSARPVGPLRCDVSIAGLGGGGKDRREEDRHGLIRWGRGSRRRVPGEAELTPVQAGYD